MNTAIAGFCLFVTIHQVYLEPLVMTLGSDEFVVREKIHKLIQAQLQVPWEEFLINGLRKNRNDAEISFRVGILTQKWSILLTEYGKYPRIDLLPHDYPDRSNLVDKYIRKADGSGGGMASDCFEMRYATYLWLTDLKNQGWWISSLQQIERKMIAREHYHFQRWGLP